MSNIKKCDRCGKTYSWGYQAKHAKVMVYDDEGMLRGTDLCPECDKAAEEWMRIKASAKGSDGYAKFYFRTYRDADGFKRTIHDIVHTWGSVSLADAMEEREVFNSNAYSIETYGHDGKKDTFGWYKPAIEKMQIITLSDKPTVVVMPGLNKLY